MASPTYISPQVKEQLLAAADFLTIIQHYHPDLKRSGAGYKGTCPSCGSTKLSVNPSKQIVKCFSCDLSAVGPINYIQKFKSLAYVEACIELARIINFDFPDQTAYQHELALPSGRSSKSDSAFRDAQLRASGITEEAQQYRVMIKNDETILNRYSVGSLNSKWEPIPGPDMLLHYLDLDGSPITFNPKRGTAEKPYIRIRFSKPELHLDQDGKPIKYMSPAGSGNHLWFPESIRAAFNARTDIDTLVFVEGEKKADALCLAGIPAVGISGIHNFSTDNDMPQQIERIITGCAVHSVVFWFDSDLFDLGSDLSKHTDTRPRTFARAAIKYRSYFARYQREGVNIQIYLCHGLDTSIKGADDLCLSMPRSDADAVHPMAKEFAEVLRAHSGEGTHLRMHQITSWTDHQIQELWHLHTPAAFMAHHKSRLMQLGEFRINRHRYRWDETAGAFVSAQKLLPDEQYWLEIDTKYGKKLAFDYLNITIFLQRRGYWRYRTAPGRAIFIQEEDNVVTEVYPEDIQAYVYEFTRGIEMLSVLRMLMQGGTQYFGPDKLKNLSYYTPPFIRPTRDQQILLFPDSFWIVTPKEITCHKHRELPGVMWRQDMINHKPTLIRDFLTIEEEGDKSGVYVDCKHPESEFYRYIFHTSDMHWRDARQTESSFPETRAQFTEIDERRWTTVHACMADKIMAAGYLMTAHMDKALMKAIVCMDAREGKSGRSEGGTGKSIFGNMFENLFSLHYIDGKENNLTDNKFLFEGVDERTRAILVDDCQRNLQFEFFFSKITHGIKANAKNLAAVFAGLKKWIFTLNGTIRGQDRSTLRRQYTIAFSDFFDPDRRPDVVFGHSLFDEWPDEEWNYWINFMAHALMISMRHPLRTFAPAADIRRRKLRDMIGDAWFEFFENYFYPESNYMNRRLVINAALASFARQFPTQKQWADKKIFKERIDYYCQYHGYTYNPPEIAHKDGRIRNAGKAIEYFVIADDAFDITEYRSQILMDTDIANAPDFSES